MLLTMTREPDCDRAMPLVADRLSRSTVNSLWGAVTAETLLRAGLCQAVISPGSRSTPLTYALATHPGWEAIPVLDERSASFQALGMARARGRPVALVCTSGTAVANYLPAVVEAAESGVPLVLLTTDRPAELRDCLAGQAIDQQKVYGSYVRFFHEVSLPGAETSLLAYLRQTLLQAVSRAGGFNPGPVHLNFPFREPLEPNEDTSLLAPDVDWTRFFAEVRPPVATRTGLDAFAGEVARMSEFASGLIVVGGVATSDPGMLAGVVGGLAKRLGWPVLADAVSSLRGFADRIPGLVSHYHAILRGRGMAESLQPDVVLAIGQPPVSKILRKWLGIIDVPTWVISAGERNVDPLHRRAIPLPVDLLSAGGIVAEAGTDCARQPASAVAGRWKRAQEAADAEVSAHMTATSELFEGKAAWILSREMPSGSCLAVANSMPVRDAETFWEPSDRGHAIHGNRGANGIDGTLSTAVGLARANGRPTYLLTGDLALLHDSNGFLGLAEFPGSLTIVLIDNRGGGIFENLAIRRFDPPFERFWATPQAVDFGALASAHGIDCRAVDGWAGLVSGVRNPPVRGVRLLHLRTDRKRDTAFRNELFARLTERLNSLLDES